MTDFSTDLRNRFTWAMDMCLESYETPPDAASFAVRSDADERAVEMLETLLATLDAVPPSLIRSAEELRSAEPGSFDETLTRSVLTVGYDFCFESATEFVEALNDAAKTKKSAN